MTFERMYFWKRRRKMIASFMVFISAIALLSFVLIAFLGTNVGRYTIQLRTDRMQLTMDTTSEFVRPTTLLRAENLDTVYPITADNLPEDAILDSGSGANNGVRYDQYGNFVSNLYFAYTFYVKNVGEDPIDYFVWLRLITTTTQAVNTVPIDEYVRIRIYENRHDVPEEEMTHDSVTFAKRTNQIIFDDQNQIEYRECIAETSGDFRTCIADREQNAQRAEEFISVDDITRYYFRDLSPEGVVRYTIVIWLEGHDPDCDGIIPSGASLEFSMDISSFTTVDA